MSFVALGVAVVGGTAKIIQAQQGRKARKAEQERANAALAKRTKEFENLEVTNPYENLENTYEDLTVNQQQAEFAAQQNAQNQSNIMQGLRQSAGGSGVAGLAQSLANQGQIAAQKASTTIGQQEQANQMASARGESARQSAVASGEVGREGRQKTKTGDLLEMDMGRKQAADDARSAAATQTMSGIGDIAGGVAGGVSYGMNNRANDENFFNVTG
tara:strand:- start:12539 stop:13186 length:648 start_codon:yes stop_codon:yes gene_type:complete